MRIRAEYKEPLENGRLLFLSIFRSHRHRADAQLALRRNRFVAALADKILVLYAAPSGGTEHFCQEILRWQKPVYTLENELNAQLVALGARPVTAEQAGLLA
jgi:predicted Rossmann fold nucleotide-binding protein DprA/Smf involved in DNA uptake